MENYVVLFIIFGCWILFLVVIVRVINFIIYRKEIIKASLKKQLRRLKDALTPKFKNIVVISAILGAFFTVVFKEDWDIVVFFFGGISFLAIIWFFSCDKQVEKFKKIFQKNHPVLSQLASIIFRIFTLLIFLFSISLIITMIRDIRDDKYVLCRFLAITKIEGKIDCWLRVFDKERKK